MLVFIDESGYPRPNDATQNPVLLGVCIHENDIKSITNQIYKLKDRIYGKQDEIKSTKVLREATITKNRTNNKTYVEGMLEIFTSYNTAVFAVIMDKPSLPISNPDHHLPKQYYLLMKKIEFYCKHHNYEKAMMIFDEVHEDADKQIAEALVGFLFKTNFGRSFQHILEMPLFVSSSITPAIQFADIFAGLVRHYYENNLDVCAPTTDYQKWIHTLYNKLQTHTENITIAETRFIEYGFQKIGTNFSYVTNDSTNNCVRENIIYYNLIDLFQN